MTTLKAAILLSSMFVMPLRYEWLDIERLFMPAAACTTAFFLMFWWLSTEDGYALAGRPLVWIGQGSYSIYLLHFETGMVLLSAKNVRLFFQLAAPAMVIAIIVALAGFSFLGLETRLRLQGCAVR